MKNLKVKDAGEIFTWILLAVLVLLFGVCCYFLYLDRTWSIVSGLLIIILEIVFIIRIFPILMAIDMIFESMRNWKKDRLFFVCKANGEGEQIYEKIINRVKKHGKSIDVENVKREPVCVRYKRTSSAEVFYSSVERNIIVYRTKFLDDKEMSDILSCAKAIASKMKVFTKPWFFLTKEERKAPACRVFVVLVFADDVSQSGIDFIRKERKWDENIVFPCAVDLTRNRYYFDGMRELHFEGMEGKPSKNTAIKLTNKILFNGKSDLKDNNNLPPCPVDDEMLEAPFFETLKELVVEDVKENKTTKKIYKNLNNGEVFEKDNLLYINKDGRVTTFLVLENEECTQDTVDLVVSGFWDYPKKNKISKKDIISLKEQAVEYFGSKNKKVEFIEDEY